MTNPSYILLTVKKITVPTQRGPAPSQSTLLNPVVRKLFPLPLAVSMAQHGREAEIDAGAGMVLTMAEDFNDVLAAIESAAASGKYIVRPIQRGAIEASVLPFDPAVGQQIDSATKIVEGVIAGADDFARRAEGAKHQDEKAELSPDDRAKIDAAFEKHKATRSGPPTPRAIGAGDLRIIGDDQGFWVEVASKIEHDVDLDNASPEWKSSFQWARFGVPPELLAIYPSADAARQAVKVAGYIRRLVEA